MRLRLPVRGFTLLEMLLVVTLLAATAGIALATYADEDGSGRDAESRRRLALIERAILGEQGAVYGGEARLSGFVAELGRLPQSMDELLASGTTGNYAAQPWPFSAAASATSSSDGWPRLGGGAASSSELTTAGFRPQLATGAVGTLRDGWGEDFQFLPAADGLSVCAPGRDGSVDAGDACLSLPASRWQVELQGWTVNVNWPASAPVTQGGQARLLLLAHGRGSGAATQHWLQYESAPQPVVAGSMQTFSLRPTRPASGSVPASTPAPQGRHLLALCCDSSGGLLAARRVDLYAHTLPPQLTLSPKGGS